MKRRTAKPIRTCLGLGALLAALLLAPGATRATGTTHAAPPEKTSAADRAAAAAVAGAQRAIAEKNYPQAATILENFLLDHPGNDQALFNLAYTYGLEGRSADAIDTYRQALEVNPGLTAARFNLGLLLLGEKKPAEAATEFKQVVAADAQNYEVQLYYAHALAQAGGDDAALAAYQQAAALKPQEAEPRRAALGLLVRKQDWSGAEAVLAELEKIAPDPQLDLDRAQIFLHQDKKAEALAAYDRYLAAAKDSKGAPAQGESAETVGEIHMHAGLLARELGKNDEALEHFRAAAGSEATKPASLRAQAEILCTQKKYAEAVPLFEQARAQDSDDPNLLDELGYAYLQTGAYAKAVPVLAHAVQLLPQEVDLYDHLAMALHLGDNPAGVLKVLDARAQITPETPATYFLRAVAHDKLGECGVAIEFYEKFLAVNKDLNSDPYFESAGRLRFLKKTCREKNH